MKYFIGVDGGGSYTKAVVADELGHIVYSESSDTINFNSVPFKRAQENLAHLLGNITARIPAESISKLFIGCSALDKEADKAVTQKLLGEYGSLNATMNSDLYIALMGHSGGGSGVLIISGTGSMGIAKDQAGNFYTCGGWGYGIGDEGSAYDIAVKGIGAAIRYYEGLGPKTQLFDAMMKHYHLLDPKDLIPKIYQPHLNRKKIAGFAVQVDTCYQAGDATAKEILCGAALALTELATALLRNSGETDCVAVYGGVFQHSQFVLEQFKAALKRQYSGVTVVLPGKPPEIGAVIAGMQDMGIPLTRQIMENLDGYPS